MDSLPFTKQNDIAGNNEDSLEHQYSSSKYAEVLRSQKRMLRSMGYCAMRNPFSMGEQHPKRPAVRPTPLSQWLVDASTLEETIRSEYLRIPLGEIRQLMTGTGAGKSARVPCIIASEFSQVVVVLQHMRPAEVVLQQYVASQVASRYGLLGQTSVLRGTDLLGSTRRKSSHVYYTTVTDFLSMYSSRPDLLRVLKVKSIILDESHSKRPEYEAMLHLAAVGLFEEVRLLYMSATAADDISMENRSMRVIRKYNPKLLSDVPAANTAASPAYFKNIIGRNLLFVAHDNDFPDWCDYYEKADIPCLGYGYCSGTTAFMEVQKFLDKNPLCVVVTTAVLASSFTLNVDNAIDTGKDARLLTDFEGMSFSVKKFNVTKSDQIQRAGRVGRYKPGVVHFADVQCSPPRNASDPDIACYVYQWCRMFNIQVKEESISCFGDLFGELSLRVVADLLTVSVPPYAALPYFADNGVYVGWDVGMESLTTTGAVSKSDSGNEEKVEHWDEYTIAEDCLGTGEHVYKSKVRFPEECALVAYHLWAHYTKEDGFEVSSMADTVVDAIPTRKPKGFSMLHFPNILPSRLMRPPSTVSLGPSEAGISYDDPRPLPPLPIVHSGPDAAPVSDRKLKFAEVQAKNSVGGATEPAPPYEPHGSSGKKVSQDPGSPLGPWLENLDKSSSGSDKISFTVIKASPYKKRKQHLYPLDQRLLYTFLKTKAVTKIDDVRFERLSSGAVHYTRLSTHTGELRKEQESYFLSLLRVHRATLGSLLQAAVVQAETRRFLSSTAHARSTKRIDTVNRLEYRIENVTKLLLVCELEGFECATRVEDQHAAESLVSSVPSPAMGVELAKERDMASIAAATGTEVFRENVNTLIEYSLPVVKSTDDHQLYVGNAWFVANMVVGSQHVFEKAGSESTDKLLVGGRDTVISSDDAVIMFTEGCGASVEYRQPVVGEYVSLLARTCERAPPQLYGFHVVLPYLDSFAFIARYRSGMSGGLLIAHTDGRIVGIYVGKIAKVEGVTYARFDALPKTA